MIRLSSISPRRRAARYVPLLLAPALVAAAAIVPARAYCKAAPGFPIFQCGDRAWFATPPDGSGALKAVFWQIGYGNAIVDNGSGSNGTGVTARGVFNGNDSGLLRVPLIEADSVVKGSGGRAPEGAICLGPVNWADFGVDGCCDDHRDLRDRAGQDGWLNPNFDTKLMQHSRQFEPSTSALQDAPIAVLLREETGRWIAVAAVSPVPRTADKPDIREGDFTLARVADGEKNPVTGKPNIVPWQALPVPRLEPSAGGKAGAKGGSFHASWDAIHVNSDLSHIPSTALGLDGPDGGIGVLDMGPLVRYTVEKVTLRRELLDAAGYPRRDILLWERVTDTGGTAADVTLAPDECVRVVVHLGRKPEAAGPGGMRCALGKCGDVGYDIPGPPVCLAGPLTEAARRK